MFSPYSSFHPYQVRPKDSTLNCVLIGYSDKSKGYWCFNPSTGKFILSRNLLFDEATFPLKQLSSIPTSASTSNSPLLYLPSSFQSPITHTTTSQLTTPSSEFIHPPPSSQPTQQLVPSPPKSEPPPLSTGSSHPMVTHLKTDSLHPKNILDLLHHSTSTTEPTSFTQADKQP